MLRGNAQNSKGGIAKEPSQILRNHPESLQFLTAYDYTVWLGTEGIPLYIVARIQGVNLRIITKFVTYLFMIFNFSSILFQESK